MPEQPGAKADGEASAEVELQRLRREIAQLESLNSENLKAIALMRRACAAVWPFVRYFGVCGASPQAVEAALEIGRIAGKIDGQSNLSLEAASEDAARARVDAIHEIADLLEESLRGKVLSKNIPEIVEGVRKLAFASPPN